MCQVRTGKANVSEPLLMCRKRSGDIETGVQLLRWDKSGGCLLIGQMVSGMKVARARFRRQCGTRERLAPMPLAGCWTGWRSCPPRPAKLMTIGCLSLAAKREHVQAGPGWRCSQRQPGTWSLSADGRQSAMQRVRERG